jgi:hypothetical protein
MIGLPITLIYVYEGGKIDMFYWGKKRFARNTVQL